MNVLNIFLLLLLCSCQSDPKSLTLFTGNEMTIDYRIQIGQALTDDEIEKVQKIIAKTFQEVDSIHNKWNPQSEISKLNCLPAFEKAPVSHELLYLLNMADDLHKISNGKFDPTIEPVHQIWKSAFANHRIPTSEEIDAIKPAIGWSKIHIDNGLFWKEHDLTSLDLCSIAKGHLVDLLIERLAHFENIYVEWGGEIRVLGLHPEGRPWTIMIRGVDSESSIAIVNLRDEAIATSGDYEHFWDYGGHRFFHIINPLTLRPLEQTPISIASVSVISPSCTFADGLATSALLFENEEKAKEWLSSHTSKYWVKTRS